jgi:hypothetical protein
LSGKRHHIILLNACARTVHFLNDDSELNLIFISPAVHRIAVNADGLASLTSAKDQTGEATELGEWVALINKSRKILIRNVAQFQGMLP